MLFRSNTSVIISWDGPGFFITKQRLSLTRITGRDLELCDSHRDERMAVAYDLYYHFNDLVELSKYKITVTFVRVDGSTRSTFTEFSTGPGSYYNSKTRMYLPMQECQEAHAC